MVEQISELKPRRLGLVWLYCHYPVLARGLVDVLEPEARIYHGDELPSESEPPSVVLCVSGTESVAQRVKELRAQAPGAAVVVFGLSNDFYLARNALQAGARGFVHSMMEPSQIIRALLVASEGEVAVPRELLKALVADEESVDLSELTDRQLEIMKLVADGQTNAQISKRLYLSESTIKQHLRAVYKVLGVHNRTEATKMVRRSAIF